MTIVRFFAAGTPVPQGSMRAFTNRATGRPILTSTSGAALKGWRDAIGFAAMTHCSSLINGPVTVDLVFYLPRPKSRPKRDRWPDRKPDIDKLARAALDALTGVVLHDDAQVVNLGVTKRYALPDGQTGVDVQVVSAQTEAVP